MWVKREQIEKINKMQMVLRHAKPELWRDIERHVESNYPTENIIRIIKKKYFEGGDTP